jgi:curved DNA-binding protein CbpA
MTDYYEILKVSRKASVAEIKSAYRRLARKLHPDKNNGDKQKALEFARLAKAYEVLSDPRRRADYDRQMLDSEFRSAREHQNNLHIRRWRQMVYEKRYNEIIDRMIADERRESMALQKILFPMVALFVSTFAVAIFRPAFFTKSGMIGKIIMLSLFVAGLIHLFGRLREAFERYTYTQEIHDSIFEGNENEGKPYSRFAAISFIVAGIFLSLGLGWIVGDYLSFIIHSSMPLTYSAQLKPEFIFYPPIVVLLVDIMHTIVSKYE